jgi:hypothetical protein
MKHRWYYKMPKQRRTRLAIGVIAGFLGFACLHAARAGDDWIPVPPEDLALKDNPANHGAHAMILYRESTMDEKHVDVDGASVREYVRIKIFTQGGTKQGDVEIPFLKDVSDIKDIRARTIQPDGSIVNFNGKTFEKVLVKLSGAKYLAKTFTMPDVQVGSIIEYKYRRQLQPGLLYDEAWTVSSDLYTREARFSIVPYARSQYPLYYRQLGLPATAKVEKQPDGSLAMTVHGIAAIEDEPYMPPEKTIEARVEFYYRSLDEPAVETPEHFWSRTGKKWNDEMERYINKKGGLEKDLGQTVSPNDPPEAKLQKIYARVQKIRDLSNEESKTKKEQKQEKLKDNSNVEDVLNHGYGTGREINYLFVGLARAAGIEATEVLVAPRNNNLFRPNMQDASELGADLVWARVGSKEYYLDPAARSFPFGLVPWFESAVQGLRLNKQGGEFVTVPVGLTTEATIVRHADLEINEDGAAVGKLEVDFTGQEGAIRRTENLTTDGPSRKKALEDEIRGWLPPGATFELAGESNWDKTSEPLHAEGPIKVPGFGTAAGRRMLAPVAVFQARQSKAFDAARRTNAVYFHFPYEETDEVKLRVPAGFKVETVPAAAHLKPGPVSYENGATQQGDMVALHRHLVVNGIVFPLDTYPALRAFFSSVKSSDEGQMVLQNAESAKND